MYCIELKNDYDIEKLIADYNIVEDSIKFHDRVYKPGLSAKVYKNAKGWKSIPLHSIGGVESDDGNVLRENISHAFFKNTPTLEKCTYFQKILDDLNAKIYLVRLMKLTADGYIPPHNDGKCIIILAHAVISFRYLMMQ